VPTHQLPTYYTHTDNQVGSNVTWKLSRLVDSRKFCQWMLVHSLACDVKLAVELDGSVLFVCNDEC